MSLHMDIQQSSVENQFRGFQKHLTGIQEGSKEKCKDPL